MNRATTQLDATSPSIEVRDLRHVYKGGHVALDGGNLTCGTGVYGLLGRSGFMTITMDHGTLIRKYSCIAHEEQCYRIVSVLKLREGGYCVNVVPETYNV